jgi:hypothetical protein
MGARFGDERCGIAEQQYWNLDIIVQKRGFNGFGQSSMSSFDGIGRWVLLARPQKPKKLGPGHTSASAA